MEEDYVSVEKYELYVGDLEAQLAAANAENARLREALSTISVWAYRGRAYHARGGTDPNEAALEGFTRIEEAANGAAAARSDPEAQPDATHE